MNKADLVEEVASAADLSKSKADDVIGALISTIVKAVTKGDSVQLVGFVTFSSGNVPLARAATPAPERPSKLPRPRP